MKKLLLFLVFFFLFLLIGLTLISREFLLAPETQSRRIRTVISQGMPVSRIADSLESRGIIRHAWSFGFLVRLTKTGDKIVAGTYDLSPSLSEHEILKILIRGQGILIRVTIPEGTTLKQIAGLLEAKGIISRDLFLPQAEKEVVEFPDLGITIHGLEGYLFPDTYDFAPQLDEQSVVQPMLARFKELVIPLYLKAKPRSGLNEIITLASLVEREGKVRKELPLIAAVYYNRLKDKMPLQCDATIQYLLPRPKQFLTAGDLQIDSPYNTYLYPGLPPGPIGNPGLAAIEAALHPARAAYRYYVVSGNKGAHAFSVDYAHHLQEVRRYQQGLLHSVPRGKH